MLKWSILGLWDILFRFGSSIMTFMIFTTFYDLFLTDADDDLNK